MTTRRRDAVAMTTVALAGDIYVFVWRAIIAAYIQSLPLASREREWRLSQNLYI
jgi:hypothetical protein